MKKVLRLPALYPKQEAFIRDPARFTWIEAGTKSGKSLACAIWLVESLWKNPKSKGWVVAPRYRQAEIIWSRCAELLPKEEREIAYKEMRIKFPNGSVLEGKSGDDPDGLYGDEVHFCAIDEASRMVEGSWHAVRSVTTRTQGIVKIIGNPRGKGNWFYRGCQAARKGDNPEHNYHHLTTADNPFIPKEEVESARRMLPEAVFAELYLGIPQDDRANVFSNVHALAIGNYAEAIENEWYVIGYDPARHVDRAVATVMRLSDKSVVGIEDLPRDSWERQIERVYDLHKEFGDAHVLMDSTGLGDVIFERLERLLGTYIDCYVFSNESKQQLIHALALSMQKKELIYPVHERLINELDAFEYEVLPSGRVRYAAPPGEHDDHVISLALANWKANEFGSSDCGITV